MSKQYAPEPHGAQISSARQEKVRTISESSLRGARFRVEEHSTCRLVSAFWNSRISSVLPAQQDFAGCLMAECLMNVSARRQQILYWPGFSLLLNDFRPLEHFR